MFQLYAFVVVGNIICGLILSHAFWLSKFSFLESISKWTIPLKYLSLIGVVAIVIGFIKLLTATPYSTFFVGDLLPSLSLIMMGKMLSVELFNFKNEKNNKFLSFMGKRTQWVKGMRDAHGNVFGLTGVALGVLHLFFPGTPLI